MNPMLIKPMLVIGMALGFLLFLIGWVPTLRKMFARNGWWGYAVFALPLLPLVHAALHGGKLKREFLFQAAGLVLIGASVVFRIVMRGH